MRPIYGITLSGIGVSTPAILDYLIPPENTTWEAIISPGGAMTFSVQYSISDPYAKYPVDYNTNGNWWDLTSASGISVSTSSNTQFPARALRLKITAYTSGTLTLNVLQAGATT